MDISNSYLLLNADMPGSNSANDAGVLIYRGNKHDTGVDDDYNYAYMGWDEPDGKFRLMTIDASENFVSGGSGIIVKNHDNSQKLAALECGDLSCNNLHVNELILSDLIEGIQNNNNNQNII